MAFTFGLSPSVEIREYDFTTGVDAVPTSIGGYAGAFEWGPVNHIVNLSNTKQLENNFGKPHDDNAADWFCAYNFLTYSNYLKCVRVMDNDATNAIGVADDNGMTVDNGFTGDASFHEDFDVDYNEHSASGVVIKNPNDFELLKNTSEIVRQAKVIAKYPGKRGNSLKVSICDGGTAFDIWEYRSYFSGAARKITVDKMYSDGLKWQDEEKTVLDVAVSEYETGEGENIKKRANTTYIIDEKSNLKGNFAVGSPYIRDISDMSEIRPDMDVYLSWGAQGKNPVTQKVGKIRSIVNKNTVRLTKALSLDPNFIPELWNGDFKMMGDTYVTDNDGEKITVYHKREPIFTDPKASIVPVADAFPAEEGRLPYIYVVPYDIYRKKIVTKNNVNTIEYFFNQDGEKEILERTFNGNKVKFERGTIITSAMIEEWFGEDITDFTFTKDSDDKPVYDVESEKGNKIYAYTLTQPGIEFPDDDTQYNMYLWTEWKGATDANPDVIFNMPDDLDVFYIPLVKYEQLSYGKTSPQYGIYSKEYFKTYDNGSWEYKDAPTYMPADQKFNLKEFCRSANENEAEELTFQAIEVGSDDNKSYNYIITDASGNEVTTVYRPKATDAITDEGDKGFTEEQIFAGDEGTFKLLTNLVPDIAEKVIGDLPMYAAAVDDEGDYMFLQYFSDHMTETNIPINFGVQLIKKLTRVSGRPATSAYAEKAGAEKDEVCIVVVDEDGAFTGTAGTVLERYTNLSKASDARSVDGTNNYWVDVVNNMSKYIWIPYDFFSGKDAFCSKTITNWGMKATEIGSSNNPVFDTMDKQPLTISLNGGWYEAGNINSGNRIDGFDCFADPQAVDVNLLIGGVLTENIADYLVDDIAEVRRDCVVLLSPPLDTNLTIDPLRKVLQFRNLVNDSTYAIWDSGWKVQYDKYNDCERYVPLCADIAGLCARTDHDRGCHWSPAGYNRGLIKNVSSLVWNVEDQDDRDELYGMGINPIMTVAGTGTLMYGDRTGTTKKTAFREIGIRRWFMKIEKAIANFSKYVLFEFNDAFTRSQFINVVNPYLRNEQGARACQDYLIQCDTTINTPEVIDAQGFVANFLIKPMHSINYIQLNFAAVATGASFDEIEL